MEGRLMYRVLRSFVQRITAGFLAILPILLTAIVVVWLADFIRDYLGPGSVFGRFLSRLGVTIMRDETIAYGVGVAVLLLLFYLVGLVVMSTLRGRFKAFLDNTVGRVPLVGSMYSLSNSFIAMLERREEVDLKSMSPVWCFFGGDAGAAVLALMPTSELIHLKDKSYCGILVPTAPIPFGGGLIFVPTDWIEPANFGVEALTQIYVSMGLAAPQYQTKPPAEPHE